jgi:hypothetical protein
LYRGPTEVASCPLPGTNTPPDLVLIDQLARMQLAAGRVGCAIRLRHVPPGLAELLELTGLAGLLVESRQLVEVGGQAEETEQGGIHVDEHRELGHLAPGDVQDV